MKRKNLNDMIKGWFVGDFRPSVFSTDHCEVAVKRYSAGDSESEHFHKLSTEITVVVAGEVKMNNTRYFENDIIVIEPNESTDFLAVTDAVTTVVKIPGVKNDKYLGKFKSV